MTVTKQQLEPHYKVRVVLNGALLHFASKVEPVPIIDGGRLIVVHLDSIDDPAYGDTPGWIDWHAVTGISWRWTDGAPR